jgi:hypothetical protein
VNDIPAVGPYGFQVRCTAPPRAVREEPGAKVLPYRYDIGTLSVTLPRLEIHSCIVVDGWKSA